ncbi:unnamed protein product [Periconia digitata]|uniref:Uncharacterized protein n=1 Tax=Periconia digitata TaxID=1303443 RepID=A0A9W4XSW0_9PLEO|nr:unnamed protein product [Periconia digitata]
MGNKKKEPKPELTDEELFSQKIRNEQARARALATWYNAASSPDVEVRLNAQARLYLQLQLRSIRKERDALTDARNTCKASGDTEGVKTVKQKLVPIYKKLQPLYLLREDIEAGSKAKMARKWGKKSVTLEELLKDEGLDLPSDFPADNSPDQAVQSNDTQPSDLIFCVVQGKVEAESCEKKGEAATIEYETRYQDRGTSASAILSQDKKEIWNRHEVIMKYYFVTMGLETHVIDTRISIQKSAFISQAKHEILVNQAYTSLLESCSQKKCVPIGCDEFLSPTGGLWMLSSTEFWQMNEVERNWEQYKRAPGGHLRVYTILGKSRLHLDFGDCSFTTEPIILPLLASPYPQTVSASCDASGPNFEFNISFWGNAYLKIEFPVHCLFSSKRGYETLSSTKTHVEFAGVFDGIF